MRTDLATLELQCSHFPWWDSISDVRQDVFVQMGYQMGFQGLLKFTSTLAAAARGAWGTVAADMRLSLWDKQTPGRAERLATQAETGVRVPEPYDDEVQPQVQPAPAQPEPNLMSLVSEFIFDPLKAAIAKALGSSNPATQATAQAAADAVTATAPAPAAAPVMSSNSPAGIAMPEIAALEDALNQAVATFAGNFITTEVPIVGGLIAPEAKKAIVAAMTFGEQHAATYLAGLFHFHTEVATTALVK
jgi:hypothetical protein